MCLCRCALPGVDHYRAVANEKVNFLGGKRFVPVTETRNKKNNKQKGFYLFVLCPVFNMPVALFERVRGGRGGGGLECFSTFTKARHSSHKELMVQRHADSGIHGSGGKQSSSDDVTWIRSHKGALIFQQLLLFAQLCVLNAPSRRAQRRFGDTWLSCRAPGHYDNRRASTCPACCSFNYFVVRDS